MIDKIKRPTVCRAFLLYAGLSVTRIKIVNKTARDGIFMFSVLTNSP